MLLESILKKAMQRHKAGDLNVAERLYRDVLSENPSDPDALNLLGVLSIQTQRPDEAVSLIRRAIASDPTVAEYHYNLAVVYETQGKRQQSRNSYLQATKLNSRLEIPTDQCNILSTAVQNGNDFPTNRHEVAQQVLNHIRGDTFLEIGLDTAEPFFSMQAKRKIGVDPVPSHSLIARLLKKSNVTSFVYSNSLCNDKADITISAKIDCQIPSSIKDGSAELYYLTSDLFFEQQAQTIFSKSSIDVALIDGLHTYEQSYKDVINTLNYMQPRGVILIHDCNPPTEIMALPASSWEDIKNRNIPGWDRRWCGDVWKSIVRLRATREDLKIFVLDCDYGIGVVSKGSPEGRLNLSSPEIDGLSFAHLSKNANELINLKPPEYLFKFLQYI